MTTEAELKQADDHYRATIAVSIFRHLNDLLLRPDRAERFMKKLTTQRLEALDRTFASLLED